MQTTHVALTPTFIGKMPLFTEPNGIRPTASHSSFFAFACRIWLDDLKIR